jgi:ABC-2 type transport system permease protein
MTAVSAGGSRRRLSAQAGRRLTAQAGRRLTAQAGMELRLLLRNGESLLAAFGIPLLLLVFFSLVEILPHGAERSVDFLVPGVLSLSIMSAAMVALGIATGFERYYLVLKRLGATPLRRAELIAAKALAVLAVEALQVGLIVALAAGLLGYRPAVGGPWWLAPLGVGLGTGAFAGLGLAMAGRLRAVATLAVANTGYLALLLLGGIAFPLERLPAPVAAVARLLPSAALTAVLRAALHTGGVPVGELVVLTGWAVGAVALAAALFRWE